MRFTGPAGSSRCLRGVAYRKGFALAVHSLRGGVRLCLGAAVGLAGAFGTLLGVPGIPEGSRS